MHNGGDSAVTGCDRPVTVPSVQLPHAHQSTCRNPCRSFAARGRLRLVSAAHHDELVVAQITDHRRLQVLRVHARPRGVRVPRPAGDLEAGRAGDRHPRHANAHRFAPVQVRANRVSGDHAGARAPERRTAGRAATRRSTAPARVRAMRPLPRDHELPRPDISRPDQSADARRRRAWISMHQG